MKKQGNNRKLSLGRETLADLDPAHLAGVGGGQANGVITRGCNTLSQRPTCFWCAPKPGNGE
jgi:hypothetical protein